MPLLSVSDCFRSTSLSANVALLNRNPQTFTGQNNFDGNVLISSAASGSIGLEVRGTPGTFGPAIALNNGVQAWDIVSWSDNTLRFVKGTGITFTPFTIRNNSFQDALVLGQNGVGIGRPNPATALDVNGTVKATAFSGSGAGLTSAGSSSAAVAPGSCRGSASSASKESVPTGGKSGDGTTIRKWQVGHSIAWPTSAESHPIRWQQFEQLNLNSDILHTFLNVERGKRVRLFASV